MTQFNFQNAAIIVIAQGRERRDLRRPGFVPRAHSVALLFELTSLLTFRHLTIHVNAPSRAALRLLPSRDAPKSITIIRPTAKTPHYRTRCFRRRARCKCVETVAVRSVRASQKKR